MILGNEVSLAAYSKMLNKNNNTEQPEDMQSNKGLLSRSQNTKTLNSGDASPAERAAMYLAEINRIRKSMKENV
tara:strand:+ start:188 stop:409 length:222 start_codon:yes stop_codon:yes gene_type:complete